MWQKKKKETFLGFQKVVIYHVAAYSALISYLIFQTFPYIDTQVLTF